MTFSDEPPLGLRRVEAPAASTCAYWRLAAGGEAFYTLAEDQLSCPIGAYTHGVDLPPESERELGGLVEQMVGLDYIGEEEVASIPRRGRKVRCVSYAPFEAESEPPDVVLVRGNAKTLMLLCEAARRAGVRFESGLMGRPTCAAIPVAEGGVAAPSLGCIGNRVYTELPDDELYVALPGPDVRKVEERLERILAANRELETYHRGQLARA